MVHSFVSSPSTFYPAKNICLHVFISNPFIWIHVLQSWVNNTRHLRMFARGRGKCKRICWWNNVRWMLLGADLMFCSWASEIRKCYTLQKALPSTNRHKNFNSISKEYYNQEHAKSILEWQFLTCIVQMFLLATFPNVIITY